ncbi:hypothetical protein AAFG13_36795 [Bradyrhizobium sp. B124]
MTISNGERTSLQTGLRATNVLARERGLRNAVARRALWAYATGG